MPELPSKFYKYTNIDGARKILQDHTLLYSHPDNFNDPFDCKINAKYEYNHNKFGLLFEKNLKKILFSSTRPELIEKCENISSLIRLWENGSEEEKKDFIKSRMLDWNYGELNTERNEETESLIKEALNVLRIFCVSETKDNILMWSHYADSHKGVAIELTMPENKNNTWAFKKNEYSDTMPLLGSTEEYVNSLLGLSSPNPKETAIRYLFTKSIDWKYEQE